MNRRNFLGAMLAACAAPAIVKAENIMRVRPIGRFTMADMRRIVGVMKEHAIPTDEVDVLFTGEMGSYESIRFIDPTGEAMALRSLIDNAWIGGGTPRWIVTTEDTVEILRGDRRFLEQDWGAMIAQERREEAEKAARKRERALLRRKW